MEQLFQQLIDESIRTNDLLEMQQHCAKVQHITLKKQKENLELLSQRLSRMEDVLLQMSEILDRDLLTILEQPLLDKTQVMQKLLIGDSTYRAYVKEGKLNPMSLGKIDYYFARDLAKALMSTKRKCKT